MKEIKTFLFHLNLMYTVWKQLRRWPNAKVTVDVHQTMAGVGRLIPRRSFEQFIKDSFTIHVECRFMMWLGCAYHMQLDRYDQKSGWYKDGKFLCEVM